MNGTFFVMYVLYMNMQCMCTICCIVIHSVYYDLHIHKHARGNTCIFIFSGEVCLLLAREVT